MPASFHLPQDQGFPEDSCRAGSQDRAGPSHRRDPHMALGCPPLDTSGSTPNRAPEAHLGLQSPSACQGCRSLETQSVWRPIRSWGWWITDTRGIAPCMCLLLCPTDAPETRTSKVLPCAGCSPRAAAGKPGDAEALLGNMLTQKPAGRLGAAWISGDEPALCLST